MLLTSDFLVYSMQIKYILILSRSTIVLSSHIDKNLVLAIFIISVPDKFFMKGNHQGAKKQFC